MSPQLVHESLVDSELFPMEPFPTTNADLPEPSVNHDGAVHGLPFSPVRGPALSLLAPTTGMATRHRSGQWSAKVSNELHRFDTVMSAPMGSNMARASDETSATGCTPGMSRATSAATADNFGLVRRSLILSPPMKRSGARRRLLSPHTRTPSSEKPKTSLTDLKSTRSLRSSSRKMKTLEMFNTMEKQNDVFGQQSTTLRRSSSTPFPVLTANRDSASTFDLCRSSESSSRKIKTLESLNNLQTQNDVFDQQPSTLTSSSSIAFPVLKSRRDSISTFDLRRSLHSSSRKATLELLKQNDVSEQQTSTLKRSLSTPVSVLTASRHSVSTFDTRQSLQSCSPKIKKLELLNNVKKQHDASEQQIGTLKRSLSTPVRTLRENRDSLSMPGGPSPRVERKKVAEAASDHTRLSKKDDPLFLSEHHAPAGSDRLTRVRSTRRMMPTEPVPPPPGSSPRGQPNTPERRLRRSASRRGRDPIASDSNHERRAASKERRARLLRSTGGSGRRSSSVTRSAALRGEGPREPRSASNTPRQRFRKRFQAEQPAPEEELAVSPASPQDAWSVFETGDSPNEITEDVPKDERDQLVRKSSRGAKEGLSRSNSLRKNRSRRISMTGEVVLHDEKQVVLSRKNSKDKLSRGSVGSAPTRSRSITLSMCGLTDSQSGQKSSPSIRNAKSTRPPSASPVIGRRKTMASRNSFDESQKKPSSRRLLSDKASRPHSFRRSRRSFES